MTMLLRPVVLRVLTARLDEATDVLSSDVTLVRRVERRLGVPVRGRAAADRTDCSWAPELRRVVRRSGVLFIAVTFSSVSAELALARVLRIDGSSMVPVLSLGAIVELLLSRSKSESDNETCFFLHLASIIIPQVLIFG